MGAEIYHGPGPMSNPQSPGAVGFECAGPWQPGTGPPPCRGKAVGMPYPGREKGGVGAEPLIYS